MPEQRHAFRLGRSLVVALPPAVQRQIGVSRGQSVYWHATRRAEVVLTKAAQRAGGHPEGLALERQLRVAHEEIARLGLRNDARDRAMYAEGYALGRADGEEVTRAPHGARAAALRHRRLAQHAWGARASDGVRVAQEEAPVGVDLSEPLTTEQARAVAPVLAMM